MTNQPIYSERLTSRKTEAVFVGLAVMFLIAFILFARKHVFGGWSILFFCLFAIFSFYALNYRNLIIRLEAEHLYLSFGIFRWEIALRNIESCSLDTISLKRIGGAGIHFTSIRGKYRAMFNFLEYPRIVIQLKTPKGPVHAIAFSTQHPEELIRLIMISLESVIKGYPGQ